MPDDNNTIPLINTIRETTLSAIAKKYNIEKAQKRFDISNSQSDSDYIQTQIDDYDQDIQDIINEIPDDPPPPPPGPTLPTVSLTGDFGASNAFYFAVNGGDYSFSPNVITSIYRTDNREYGTWDDSQSYATFLYRDYNNTYRSYTGIVPYKMDGKIYMQNQTGATLTVSYIRIAVCSSNEATVITVYNTSNEAFNAFKYTDSGTDYYYVLDGVQNDWTDDLSSIGYHLPVQLPSVTTINVSLSALGQSKLLANDETSALYNSSTGYSQVLYDTSKVYATVYMNASAIWHSGFPLENGYGVVTVRNKTGSTMTIYGGIIAQCDNVDASVVTVYNSSNTAYNAFKYTVDGTDYYYVLDEVQTDWTDDLSSIGYHLPVQNPSCYFTSQGASATSDFTFQGSTNYYMYDASGQMIAYDTSKTYTIIAKYNKEGQSVTGDFADGIKFVNYNGYLGTVRNWSSGPAYLFRIEYTVS